MFEDIVRIAGKVAGEDLKPFFDEFVAGKKRLPIAENLQRAGFEFGLKGYAGEVYLWKNSKANDREKSIRNLFLKGN